MGKKEKMDEEILWVIPGFGEPNYRDKELCLLGNILMLKEEGYRIRGLLCLYSVEKEKELEARLKPFLDERFSMTIHAQRGFLGRFLYQHVKPEWTTSFSLVLLSLDDVQFEPGFSIGKMRQLMEKHALDVISPAISKKSEWCHPFMHPTKHKALRHTNFAEFFCYLLKPSGYTKYHQFFNENTQFMWGIDLCMHPYGMKMAILETMTVIHLFSARNHNKGQVPEMERELRRMTKRFPNHIRYQFKNLGHLDKIS